MAGQIIHGNLLVKGGTWRKVTRITDADSPYTVLETDFCIEADTTSGAITCNLPTLASSKRSNGVGRELRFKVVNGSNSLTIDGSGAEEIDGSTTLVLTADNDGVEIMAGTDDWMRTAQPPELQSADIAADAIDSQHYAAGSIDAEHMAANSIDSDSYVDGSIDAAHYADGSITPVKLATTGYRVNTGDAALTIGATDGVILVSNVAGGALAATMTATHQGHRVTVRATAGDGSNYYTMAVTGGTITLDADLEAAEVCYSGSAWELVGLMGATFA